jgi:hypothetical protein
MSNLSQFTNKQNLSLLWEVLLDELNINISNKYIVNNIRTVFESNINPFSSRANPNSNIMELNKQFLSQVVLAVHRLFPNLKNLNEESNNIKKITISDEDVLEPYKIEDIHSLRQNDFEKEVERKRMDMENYMTPQKPRELNFSDKNSDSKIKSMDSLIADKMAQRNLEIEQFQNNNNSLEPEKWLVSKETSVKNEKTFIAKQKSINNSNSNSRLKHISFDSNNNVTLSINEIEPKLSKKVSWDNQLQYDEEPTINIFNKLKKHPIIEQNNDGLYNSDEKQYVEQKSIPLPQVKQEEIIRKQNTLVMLTPNNEPIIPKTEMIKQLNEMNQKIDTLFEMVKKLTNLIEQTNKVQEGVQEDK